MSQMNQFDFYSVTVQSHRKTDLKKMGLKNLNSRKVGHKTYRNGMSYPQYVHECYVGFCEADSNPDSIKEEWEKKCVGSAKVRVVYVARD